MYSLRKADSGDVTAVSSLLSQIILEFRSKGIDMWQNGYPSTENIVQDVADGGAYVAVADGRTVGYMYVRFGPEEFHATLKGEWRDADCSVMHRLLTDSSTRGTGLGRYLIDSWERISRENGCTSMRTETDATNMPMRGLMRKCGFQEMGVLRFDNSDKIGFEKII